MSPWYAYPDASCWRFNPVAYDAGGRMVAVHPDTHAQIEFAWSYTATKGVFTDDYPRYNEAAYDATGKRLMSGIPTVYDGGTHEAEVGQAFTHHKAYDLTDATGPITLVINGDSDGLDPQYAQGLGVFPATAG